jgi:hypothetical protein
MWTLKMRLAVLVLPIAPLVFFCGLTDPERRVFVMHVATLPFLTLPILLGIVVGYLSWNYDRFLKTLRISGVVLAILTALGWRLAGVPSGFQTWQEADWILFVFLVLLWAAALWGGHVVVRTVVLARRASPVSASPPAEATAAVGDLVEPKPDAGRRRTVLTKPSPT